MNECLACQIADDDERFRAEGCPRCICETPPPIPVEEYKPDPVKEEILSTGTGGSNRGWTARYKEMKLKYEIIQKMGCSDDFKKGFELCMQTFEHNPITKRKKR